MCKKLKHKMIIDYAALLVLPRRLLLSDRLSPDRHGLSPRALGTDPMNANILALRAGL